MVNMGRLLGSEYGDLTLLAPLSFTCEVKGIVLTATVTAKLNHPTDFFYRIRFSDGYVSDFTVTESGKWYDMANEKEYRKTEKQPYSPYADAIRNDLRDLHLFEVYENAFCFRMPVKGAVTNVYVLKESEEEGGRHDVRFNGQYQFSLVKLKNVWHAGSKVEKHVQIDNQLARNIYLLIEAHQ